MKYVLKEGKISKLEGGDSGQTYLVNHNKKKFVLREYENEKAADYYVMVHKKLQQYGFFPNLYYKEKNKILFEYIDGRDCKKSDALKVAYQVGKICATINKLKLRSVDKDSKNVNYALELFRKNNFLNEEDIRALEVRYETMRNKLKPKLTVEFDDVYAENFRLRKGKVYLVDIEDIDYKYQGRGIGKAFLRWFKTKKQRQKFKQGYESIASMKFVTEDYLQFLYLNFLTFSLAYKVKNRKNINPKDKIRLIKIINGEKI